MRHFRDPIDDSIHALEDDQLLLKGEGFIELTEEEVDRLYNPENYLTEEERLIKQRQAMPRLNQRQFRKILRDNGIFEQARDFVYSSGNGYIEDAWEYSEYFTRLDPLLKLAMDGIGLTDEQVDVMWSEAQT